MIEYGNRLQNARAWIAQDKEFMLWILKQLKKSSEFAFEYTVHNAEQTIAQICEGNMPDRC